MIPRRSAQAHGLDKGRDCERRAQTRVSLQVRAHEGIGFNHFIDDGMTTWTGFFRKPRKGYPSFSSRGEQRALHGGYKAP